MKLNWIGSFSQGSGYLGSGELMCVALERLGVDVRQVGFSKTDPKNLTPEGLKIRNKVFKKFDTAICYGYPLSFSSLAPWKFKIGFTMFETNKLPESKYWSGEKNVADTCNELDLLLVPSKHNKKLFEDHGVTIPIEVVNLGYEPSIYKYVNRKERDKFTFLIAGNLSVRKNVGAVVRAFMELFADKQDVQLVIKTSKGSSLNQFTFPTSNIRTIAKRVSAEDMAKIYHDADCFVFPSRGEGFGLPPLEAMATGLPVILADHTGMSDYIDDRYCYPIKKYKLVKAQFYPKKWGDVGTWYEPDYEELKRLMLEVYKMRKFSKVIGKHASMHVKKNFTYRNTALKILDAIQVHS